MKFAKRITSLCLTLALCASPALAAGVEDQFPAKNPYPGYADVPAGAWFEKNAKLCYETGLMTGTDAGFQPERNMRVSEVAVIAARILEAVTGEAIVYATPKPGETLPWYFSQAEYLKRHGVTLPEDMDANATRSDFLALLSAVIPSDLLAPVNTITALPDSTDPAVLTFYNAGILTGTNKYGTFDGHKPLTRMEGAAMVSRVVRENLRERFTPADYAPFTAAGLSPFDVLFEGGVTAGAYIPMVMTLIETLEAQCVKDNVEFNWFNTVNGSQTFLDYVKENSLSNLGVTKAQGTTLYQNFDLQVFYSRYIDMQSING